MAEELDEEMLEFENRYGKKNKGGNEDKMKKVVIVLAVVACLLAIVLAWVWISNSRLVGELNQEKADLTGELIALQSDYDSLSTTNLALNDSLNVEKEKVEQLIDRLQKTNATNRAKIRQYEKELGTLRSIMRNYIVQIDSLNNLNHKLTADAAKARKEAAQRKKENEELAEQVESLTGQVAVGSIIKARAVKVEAFNAADKVVDKSNKVVRLIVSLSLIENQLAPKGPVRVYVKIKGPDGQYIPAGEASREVDYEGSEVDMSIYINNIGTYVKGIYTAEVYSDATSLGSAEVLLR